MHASRLALSLCRGNVEIQINTALGRLPWRRPPQEYYETLGVEKGATEAQIKKAWKKKSLEFHPDKLAQRGLTETPEMRATLLKINRVRRGGGRLRLPRPRAEARAAAVHPAQKIYARLSIQRLPRPTTHA